MKFCRNGDGSGKFSPKGSTGNFAVFNKTDIGKIGAIEFNLSIAIKAGFITALRRNIFKRKGDAFGQSFGIVQKRMGDFTLFIPLLADDNRIHCIKRQNDQNR